MGILIGRETRAIVQGITGGYARAQVKMMLEYGTKIVAGVSPGREGIEVEGVPVYDTVRRALAEHPAEASVVYVSAPRAKEVALEALDNGIKLLVIGTEGIPVHDTMRIRWAARANGAIVVGPNGIGLTTAGECCLGTVIPSIFPGSLGIVSRSGSLSGQILRFLNEAGIGETTYISAGGDFVLGTNPVEYLRLFQEDIHTRVVLFIGEIGGMKEYEVADYLPEVSKPVIAYIVGRSAVPGKRMGHIGAIIGSSADGAEAKREYLRKQGAFIADTPWQIIDLVKQAI